MREDPFPPFLAVIQLAPRRRHPSLENGGERNKNLEFLGLPLIDPLLSAALLRSPLLNRREGSSRVLIEKDSE